MDLTDVKIVADSSADVLSIESVSYTSAPLIIRTTQKEYVDNADLDVSQMVKDLLSNTENTTTACPGVGDWIDAFGDAKYVFCVTITSGLSGSYNSAMTAKQNYEEAHPDRKVFVIDSLSAGPELKLIIEKLQELIIAGKSYEEICTLIPQYMEHTGLIFTLESVRNLANNGRVSHLVASAVGILGIRILGRASAQGTLEQIYKCRGEKKALPTLLKMLQDYKFNGGKLRIGHVFNDQAAIKVKEMVLDSYPNADIEIYPLRGLCSFYAENGGVLIGFEKE
ncbi:MAG: DegV family protein [Lachnospiraceae bacterium]|nr:DegV family protein [Lachnospiraceae bacterium]MBQ7777130.1 DegV family protein [Lachnospiraceae bacterium]